MMRLAVLLPLVVAGFTTPAVTAEFTIIQEDFAAWKSLAGPFTTIDFTGYPNNTYVTDQYANLGVVFSDPDPNVIHTPAFSLYPLDGAGLFGVCTIEMQFATPINTIAFHHPGIMFAEFFLDSEAISTSIGLPGPGVNRFQGLLSDQPFDRVKLSGVWQPTLCQGPSLDNLYFSTIPAPGGVGLVAGGMLLRSRRRCR